MIFKLAWRNLWRNKRRTLITMGSVFFAVIFAVLMMGLKEGIYVRMMDSLVGQNLGYVKLFGKGYWEEQILDRSFRPEPSLREFLEEDPSISGLVPRVETVSLASSHQHTKVALVQGIDPEAENGMTGLADRIKEGSYLQEGDRAVLIGIELGRRLELGVGDTLVLIGQGFHGNSAAGKYPIKGIFKVASPDLNKQLVAMPLPLAQELYSLGERITSMAINVHKPDQAAALTGRIREKLGENYDVLAWNEMVPDVERMIESDRAEGVIFMGILYMIIGFGMFGTVLMMVAERQHEFGMLVGLGMKRSRLAAMVQLEVIFMGLTGALAGMVASWPVLLWFYYNPIRFEAEMAQMYEEYGFEPVMQSSTDPGILLDQGIFVFVLALIVSIYPSIKLLRLNALEAMRK